MSHAVIPAPVRFDRGKGLFALQAGTGIAYAAAEIAPIVERFCSEVARRSGLRLAPVAGGPAGTEPLVRIELATGDELGLLPAPVGVSPTGGSPASEGYLLTIDADQVALRAADPAGVAHGLTTLLQLLVATPYSRAAGVSLPGARILDAPRYAWRGLSLDLARASFSLAEVRRVIDLLALYKLNVLHLHLTDDQSWRLPVGRPSESSEPDGTFYSADDLRALTAYAADRFVTVVPEVDTPGHASALMQMHPALNTGRNQVEFEMPPGHRHHTVWLDPELPGTAGCGRKTTSPTFAPPPWTGSNADSRSPGLTSGRRGVRVGARRGGDGPGPGAWPRHRPGGPAAARRGRRPDVRRRQRTRHADPQPSWRPRWMPTWTGYCQPTTPRPRRRFRRA